MKSKTKIILSFIFLMICNFSYAQIRDSLPKKSTAIYNGDSIRLYNLPDVYVYGALDPTTVDNMQKYYKLRRDIIRAYPYAKLSSAMLKTINDSLSNITSKRARKKYIKSTEAEMKIKFEDELKKLTINQGKILIKLIDRETGSTSYELVKSYRGVFEAFLWQTTARFFGSSLKEIYDPEGQDKVIESIVQAIERGEISVAKK
ncbi:MAG: DUF4294 domain-containing protein [Bacteroidia bacterium]